MFLSLSEINSVYNVSSLRSVRRTQRWLMQKTSLGWVVSYFVSFCKQCNSLSASSSFIVALIHSVSLKSLQSWASLRWCWWNSLAVSSKSFSDGKWTDAHLFSRVQPSFRFLMTNPDPINHPQGSGQSGLEQTSLGFWASRPEQIDHHWGPLLTFPKPDRPPWAIWMSS